MDAGGTYGNVFGGRTPMSPAAPAATNEQYKVNVTRQKTKKWANFKPQNYDGDDWGADYDDAPSADDAPPPPPPSSLKPANSRLPSGPAILSSRQFTPLGGPPQLHLQTSRAVSTPAGPASAGGLLERTAAESLVSPVANVPQSAIVAPSMNSGRPPPSALSGAPLPSRNKAPIVLQSAGPVPNLPPPTLPQLGTSARPGSSAGSAGKTHSEARSASPASSSMSPLTSPAKPLPFIRPADIYRRMEEERERQKSIDSSDRPSFDSGRAEPRPHSSKGIVSAQPAPGPVVEGRLEETDEREERDAGARWIGLPYLPPLIERKSEYGLEGLLESYGPEESVTATAPEPEPEPETVLPRTTNAVTPDHPKPVSVLPSQQQAPEPTPSRSNPGEELRPSSTSPKLPELGRLSVFGADFFSSNLSSAPPVPTITSSWSTATKTMGSLTPSPMAPVAGKSEKVAQDDAVSQPGAATAAARTDASPNRRGEDVRSAGPPPSHNADPANETGAGNLQQQDAAAEASRQTASSGQDKQRPRLPGSWVTETATTPGDIPTPAAIDAPLSQRGDPNSGVTTPKAESNEKGDKSIEATAPSRQLGGDGAADPAAKQDTLPAASQKDSAMALPPLETLNPVPSTARPATASQSTAPAADPDALTSPPPQSQVAREESTSPISNPATSPYADIAPTAPLKAGRGAQSIGAAQDDFEPPPTFGTGLSLDTASSSPVKESDMLREEIMKSLSPLNPSADFDEHTRSTSSAYHAAAGGPVRESSYLGDVYDDYWSEATPDVPQIPSDPVKKQEGVSDALPEAVSHSPRPLSIAPRENLPASAAPVNSGEKPFDLRRQFSWEMSGQKTPGLAPSPVRADPASAPEVASPVPQESPSLAFHELAAPPVLVERQTPSSGISYQVSNASTAPPRAELDAGPLEPPSPVSVRSGENVGRRQSLAEQKSLIQTSANPVSPSPPLDQHPAVVAQEQQRTQQAAGLPDTPTGPETLNLMTFRQIMEVPSVQERTKHYNDTRYQFAAIDTGLEEWMQHLKSQHPEHAHATPSLREGLIEYMAASMTVDSQAEGQSTYSPHQANASTAAFGHASRPSTNIPMPPPPTMHGNNPFGHSSGQVGVKSKKLLLAAGKAGKGLLSKGRHKLSTTGEKVFHN
ncbi:hypothetical protein QBC39DRAFT_115976 [Podospora conica]|nr:hypothetical protein QBC39DRAFT_115976 [Schizothecium conicum]